MATGLEEGKYWIKESVKHFKIELVSHPVPIKDLDIFLSLSLYIYIYIYNVKSATLVEGEPKDPFWYIYKQWVYTTIVYIYVGMA